MTAKLGSEDWAPQAPPADFAATVSGAMPLRQMAEEWTPQQPASAFGFLATAFVVQAASGETQQGRVGLRTIRAILRDAGGADVLGGNDPSKQAKRGLLVHMFFRFVEREASRILAEADDIESDEESAMALAKDSVRKASETSSRWGHDGSGLELEEAVGFAASRRLRSFHVEVCKKMQRPAEIAGHVVDGEDERWRVVREAFLFFLDKQRKAHGVAASSAG